MAATLLEDELRFSLPFGALGQPGGEVRLWCRTFTSCMREPIRSAFKRIAEGEDWQQVPALPTA